MLHILAEIALIGHSLEFEGEGMGFTSKKSVKRPQEEENCILTSWNDFATRNLSSSSTSNRWLTPSLFAISYT